MIFSSTSTLKLACGVGALAMAQLSTTAMAQDISPPDATPATAPDGATAITGEGLSDIVVTARRTRESIMTAPLAVQAVTADQLDVRGVTTITSLQDFTPGFRYVNQTFGRNDRGYKTYVMRGIYGGDGAARQPVRIFVDGTPIISGDIAGFDAIERIEVVPGPQSAYFGRSTFGGAVNFITKTPSMDGVKATGSVEVSSYNSQEYRASVEGPLLADTLSARVSVLYDKDGGQYRNFGLGGRLGKQVTKSVSGSLYFTPSPSIRIKAFGQYWENIDGLPAQGLLGASFYNCNAGSAPAGSLNYVCGKQNKVPASSMFYNVNQFDSQTRAAVTSNKLVYFLPDNFIMNGGLKRKASQGLVSGEWDFADGWLLAGNASFMDDKWANLIDAYQQPTTLKRLLSTPQHLKGRSAEVRMSSPEMLGGLKLTAGANYLYQNILAAATGTLTVSPLATAFFSPPGLYVGKTLGFFGAAHYAFTSALSLDVEGRYQSDKVRQAIAPAQGVTTIDNTATFKSFTPKAVLSYQLDPHNMIYASYSRGTRPGEFNVSVFSLPPATRDALIAQSNAKLKLGPEKLDMYELGFKGQFLDNKVRLLAAAYYGDWSKRHVTAQFLVGTTFVTPITDVGSVELYGVELKAEAQVVPGVTLEGTFAYNESKIKNTFCTACLALTGNASPDGTRLPAYPAWTGSASATYSHEFDADTTGFLRADYIYTGKQYDSESNLAWTAPANKINLRAGIERGRYSFEVFGRNIFDNKAPSSIFRTVNALQGGSALAISPPERATVGVKLSVKG